MPFVTKQNKRIKVQGSLETLRQKTLYLPPRPTHILGRSIVFNELKRERRRRRRIIRIRRRRKKRRVE